MLRTVLWVAAACAAVLLALAASRMMNVGDKSSPPPSEVVEPASGPKPAAEPEPVAAPAPKPTYTPDELQIQEDAAATGMTTIAPEDPPSVPPAKTAPTN